MLESLAWTALLMGLAGGPHCLAMCAAPCSGLLKQTPSSLPEPPLGLQGGQPLRWMPQRSTGYRLLAFHAGRVFGYAAMGALAAWAMGSLAWLTQQAQALRPVWTLMHVAVMAWGLLMMVQSQQPAWVERAGRSVWRWVQPLVGRPGGLVGTGFLWALMPCGLLYSALLVAALSGGVGQGAVTMALFALGSSAWLLAGPWLWVNVRNRVHAIRADWGTRLAGAALCGVAGWALWMDLIYKPSLWCR